MSEKNLKAWLVHLVKYHLHILLYTYFWFGLFVCGLVAPDRRIAELESDLIGKGWHLSLLSLVLILPIPILYIVRMNKAESTGNPTPIDKK